MFFIVNNTAPNVPTYSGVPEPLQYLLEEPVLKYSEIVLTSC